MKNGEIKRLEKEDRLRREKTGVEQIETFVNRSRRKLESARRNLKDDPELSYECAYDAIRQAGEAMILSFGYRALLTDHHKTVVRFVQAVLDTKFSELIETFDRMRRNRNEIQYGGRLPISTKEAESSIKIAEQLVPEILNVVRQKGPQKYLDL